MNPRKVQPSDFPTLGTIEDQIGFILNFAVIAPSTHNTQPWLFKLEGNICKIFIDRKYLLPEADREGRDLYISMGCMFENLIIAGNYFKVLVSLDVTLQDQNNEQIAEVVFQENKSGEVDTTSARAFEAMRIRINARGIFANQSVNSGAKNSLTAIADSFSTKGISLSLLEDKNDILTIASLTKQGLMSAYKRKSFRREMSGWMNSNISRKKEGIPGYALKIPFFLSLIIPKLIRYKDIGKKLGILNERSISSAPLVAIITAKQNEPRTWIDIGTMVEKMFIEMYAQGYQTSIFVASIEMGEYYKDIQNLIKTEDRPQFLFIVGKVDSLHKVTPRHNLADKLIK
ncbi:MAG: hypothetical protein RL641_714 [Candidatus Parcubacteria bacterium]|jgi:hypothetical protein